MDQIGSANPLSQNSSETAWNFQTPFYRVDTDSLRMVCIHFYKHICIRDFSGGAGEFLAEYFSLPNSSRTAWNFQTPLTWLVVGSIKMVYGNFHRAVSTRDFSMTAESLSR